jgi:hypothetical protein
VPTNPKVGADSGMEAVLDTTAPELNEKLNDGVRAASVVVVEPDADEPKINPMAAPEKMHGVDAVEEAPTNELTITATEEVDPNGFEVVAVEEVPLNRPGVLAEKAVPPNRLEEVPVEPVVDATKRSRLLVVVEAPKNPGLLGTEVAAPNKLGVVPSSRGLLRSQRHKNVEGGQAGRGSSWDNDARARRGTTTHEKCTTLQTATL